MENNAMTTGYNRQMQSNLSSTIMSPQIKARFDAVLGQKSAAFISSVISVVNANYNLKQADQMSIISAAMVAASLDLPIVPTLGYAHIVPYLSRKANKYYAQFQTGWKSFVQLGMRTEKFKMMNACEVYEGEIKSNNRFTGEIEFDSNLKKSDKIIGYVAYFKLLCGYEKFLYKTIKEIEAHGRKFSKSYEKEDGMWKKDFDSMAKKTVLKELLSKWAPLSTEMQRAIISDQAVINGIDDDAKIEYIDNPQHKETYKEPLQEPQPLAVAEEKADYEAPVSVNTKESPLPHSVGIKQAEPPKEEPYFPKQKRVKKPKMETQPIETAKTEDEPEISAQDHWENVVINGVSSQQDKEGNIKYIVETDNGSYYASNKSMAQMLIKLKGSEAAMLVSENKEIKDFQKV